MSQRGRGSSLQQLRQAEAIVEEWALRSASTEPADRPAAEGAIRELYRMHGWAAPRFVWVESPLGAEVASWILGARPFGPDRGRRSLREVLFESAWDEIGPRFLDSVRTSVTQALGEELRLDEPPRRHLYCDEWPDVWDGGASRMPFGSWLLSLPGTSPFTFEDRSGRPHLHLSEALEEAYHSQVQRAVRAVLDESLSVPVPLRFAHLVSRESRRALETVYSDAQAILSNLRLAPLGPAEKFTVNWVAQHDLYRWLGLVRYPHEIDAMLDLCVAVTRSCGGWSPFPRMCLVTERPDRFETDWPEPNEPRPHSATGPALTWRDGWSVYAWRGIGVSKRLIDGQVTVTDWLKERNAEVRRAMLERMGHAWLLENGAARKIAQDEYGTLWSIHDPRSTAGIVVVEVENSTPEPDGSFKRYVLRVPPDQTVPRDAIGWTFGLRPGEYDPITMT